VHKRSKHPNAIPLLFCHTWPSSFVEAEKIIDALTDPQEVMGYGVGSQMAFHVVVPSIPGFGFSDAAVSEGFGVEDTARAFNAVMGRLGYVHDAVERIRSASRCLYAIADVQYRFVGTSAT
jgi:pimeloyl-ACP methyl ester carboxylesterase